MYLLRRAATRALASTPSTALFVKPRSITTVAPAAFRLGQSKSIAPAFQRRWASDEATKTDEEAATEASENFSQTATEAPVEENLSPAQATSGIDALEQTDKGIPGLGARHRSPAAEPNTTIYVGNLYYEVTADQLKRIFSRFGEVSDVKIVYDNRGLSRGFGYIEFNNTNDAQAAVENLDMQVFEGRNLVVQFHKPKPNSKTRTPEGSYQANPPSKTLFIGNMSFEMSDKDLNDMFRDIRNVMDVRVAIDRRTGQPRGFAHADFIDVASATLAREALQDKTIYGRQLRIDFSKSSSGTRDSRRED
ncbi:RNA binding domain-containing protein [Massarina eburnea CBS 473.64]|uniref:RNA binding domain-containing protein n=1 Tax=Massarina eburnea CBS 473.64 TaxID=1395130 RepID=A0A6A6RNU1_9PLEO|nr:RNA binding domain-containing protein [Massarina eburnea CBS 473.64]